ncbi:MAG TPA: MFS transporter [Candidatus Sulfotelmatobacter sp.]|nr:MFS transporter [Candidatus Sulfotelmatobacter sp.]
MLKKLAYSFGGLAQALSFQIFSTYVIFFYVDVMKLSPYLAGIGIMIYGVWNAVNDPLFGFLSDRTRSRWGRRIPYIAAGAVPLGLVYWLLWVPPFRGLDQTTLLFVYFVVMICLFDGFYSLAIINWQALFPEMFSGVKERAQVNSYRQVFAMLGLLIGVLVPPLIYNSLGWGWMGAIFGLIVTLVLLIVLWGSHEPHGYDADRPLAFWPALKATLKNGSFLTFVAANLFIQYAFITILATMPFFAKYVLKVGPEWTAVILATAFLTMIPMFFVWRRLTVRFGEKQCLMAATVLLAVALAPLFYVSDLPLVLALAVLIGAALAGFLQIIDILIADIIDEDETNSGVRREGAFFGMNAFLCRFAIGLEALSMSSVFILTGYNPYIYTQPREFQFGLRCLLAGLPIAALALAVLIFLFYPLAGKRLEELRARMAEMHRQKGVEE